MPSGIQVRIKKELYRLKTGYLSEPNARFYQVKTIQILAISIGFKG
jgi:hypothetical protein